MFFKKAVVVIHGFVGGTHDNEHLVNYLQYKGSLDVYAFTLKGHEKPYISGVKYQEWIKQTEEYIEYLSKKYKTIYVVGHSMGGVIASYLAVKYPQIKKLVLVSPAFEFVSQKQNLEDLANIRKIIKNETNLTAYEVVLSKMLLVPLTTIVQFLKLVKRFKNHIKCVNIKTLIIHGELDEVIPITSSQYAFDSINSKKKYMTILKGVRHSVFRSKNKDEISLYVYRFLKGGFKWKKTYKSIL